MHLMTEFQARWSTGFSWNLLAAIHVSNASGCPQLARSYREKKQPLLSQGSCNVPRKTTSWRNACKGLFAAVRRDDQQPFTKRCCASPRRVLLVQATPHGLAH